MAQLRMVPATWDDPRQEGVSSSRVSADRVLFYEGERVYLRPIELADEFALRKWLNDPAVRNGLVHQPPLNAARERAWIEAQGMNPEEYHFGIVARAGDRLIGMVSLIKIHLVNRSAELVILIGDPDYQSRGFGTEAVRLVVRYGFEEMNLNRIELGVYATNTRAIRCYEKAGFVYEGCYRQSLYRNGRYVDESAYAILKEEWLKTQECSPA
jgi:RimJ/RimL family protein N-acetyltransferase